jgi:FkbM family methyltransferase
MFASVKGMLRRSGLIDRAPFRGFLREVSGVIHVGAHIGQERDLYAQYRLNVLWIEPIEVLFAQLQKNIAHFPRQRAIRSLVTDQEAANYAFHITNNAGASSSIFSLGLHKDVWPEVQETQTVEMNSVTLPTLLAREHIDVTDYDALIMDTQGSELLILKGAESILRDFTYIKTEVADFAAYEGGCQLSDIESYLANAGFVEYARQPFANHPSGGAYYDIVYKRESDVS